MLRTMQSTLKPLGINSLLKWALGLLQAVNFNNNGNYVTFVRRKRRSAHLAL